MTTDENHMAAVRAATQMFRRFNFVVRGDAEQCWVDRLSEPDEDGMRTVVATVPGSAREFEMFEAWEKARGDMLAFIAGKGTEMNLALNRVVGLEQIIDFALMKAPDLGKIAPTRRKAALKELLAAQSIGVVDNLKEGGK